jgi:hypothetical protein
LEPAWFNAAVAAKRGNTDLMKLKNPPPVAVVVYYMEVKRANEQSKTENYGSHAGGMGYAGIRGMS